MSKFAESVVEDAALAWLASLGWTVVHGPDIAPGELAAERTDYGLVVLEQRLRDALARLNPELPTEAQRDAFGKLSEKFPDPTGLMTAELFKCYQAFEAASGALGSVADAAKDAFQRVEKDLIPVRQKNKELDQAFTAASEASDKRRKAK